MARISRANLNQPCRDSGIPRVSQPAGPLVLLPGRQLSASAAARSWRGESLSKPNLINPLPLVEANGEAGLVLALSPCGPVGELSLPRADPRPYAGIG